MKLFKAGFLTILLLVTVPIITYGKYESGFLHEIYFGRHPSVRAESLGRAYSSIDGDLASIFYNPAGTASLKGITAYASSASPLYLAKNGEYNFIAGGYNFNKYLTFGFSRNHFTLGQEIQVLTEDGRSKEIIPTNTLYSLNLSSEPIKNMFIGVNANYLEWDPVDNTTSTVYFDLGVIKRIKFGQQDATQHSINFGASISNLNFAKINLEYNGGRFTNDLPAINRYGVNYQIDLHKKWISDTLSTLKLMLQGDYQVLLNSKYNDGFYFGLELMFLEILAVRTGYYNESKYDYNIPDYNYSKIMAFTYGFGIQAPLNKLTKIPLKITFDYTSLPQPSYSKTNTNWDNFSTFTFSVNWILRDN